MESLLSFHRYRLPFRHPVRTGHGVWTEREGLYLRGTSPDGQVRYAEVSPVPGFSPESVEDDEALLLSLGDRLDPQRVQGLPAHAGALRRGLHRLLGEDFTPKATSLGVAALLPAGKAALHVLPEKADIGYRVFKWKVGVHDPADERGILADLAAALPEGARLRLDANGAWEPRIAERWIGYAADFPIEYIEQPLAAGDPKNDARLLGLSQDYPTPLALDESLVGDSDIERWLGQGWPGIYVLKPSLLGSLPEALERLAKAKAQVVFSSALETALGARAALEAAFSWQGPQRALGFGVWPLFQDSRFDGPQAGPFLRWEDVERLQEEPLWTATT